MTIKLKYSKVLKNETELLLVANSNRDLQISDSPPRFVWEVVIQMMVKSEAMAPKVAIACVLLVSDASQSKFQLQHTPTPAISIFPVNPSILQYSSRP